MKISFSTLACPDFSWTEIYSMAKDVGFNGIEIRGIGIVDVKNIFGMGAVKESEKIDLIIHLETWEQGKQYDRLGLVDEYTNILGLDIPSLTIPVRPGRNIAVIIEAAAVNYRHSLMSEVTPVDIIESRMDKIN